MRRQPTNKRGNGATRGQQPSDSSSGEEGTDHDNSVSSDEQLSHEDVEDILSKADLLPGMMAGKGAAEAYSGHLASENGSKLQGPHVNNMGRWTVPEHDRFIQGK